MRTDGCIGKVHTRQFQPPNPKPPTPWAPQTTTSAGALRAIAICLIKMASFRSATASPESVVWRSNASHLSSSLWHQTCCIHSLNCIVRGHHTIQGKKQLVRTRSRWDDKLHQVVASLSTLISSDCKQQQAVGLIDEWLPGRVVAGRGRSSIYFTASAFVWGAWANPRKKKKSI